MTGHCVILSGENKELINLFNRKDCLIRGDYVGLKPYVAALIIKTVASSWDDDTMALMRAEIEAEIDLIINK
ncbi:MAG: hypothetical protein OEY89_01355 [Gammaproteobacteria bacterium]|nr:hypothetical protein [Gammaproteobacteria bacterium]